MLAAPIRLLIVCQLGRGDRDVSTLATATGRSISAISNHLAKLKRAGLVRAERHGKHMVHAIADPTVLQMVDLALATHRPPPHMPPPAAHEAMDDTPVGPAPPSGPAGGAVTGPLTPLRHPHCDG
ncbi:helix-turn-helix transcriptional regulator [Mycobacterium sp. CBMA247]|nr:helix-turn-helix transcriptional regulator [Mycolicibacterium sp. CBMA 329]MUL89686.1 helix-turn-helix transcriptional regulator [Mycolicibacterium sp. CBMA 331]MUL99861.1 helix-turn-helix transcriptional regulator [Mycolicibacterium sp. CBMA 334]MUM27016.1 helix-turn-helix transcriptional regulator [Mycolicibacterium sp. CBMA 295]MUM39201.1 helix-turn-helix transcriptional regulator [Mycolicibacterium sp. CBMA 247]MUM46287.1 helix-turn-helix transcriptional regulator [Mycolicibacterium sp.